MDKVMFLEREVTEESLLFDTVVHKVVRAGDPWKDYHNGEGVITNDSKISNLNAIGKVPIGAKRWYRWPTLEEVCAYHKENEHGNA